MPTSAIEAGVVDYTLPIAELAIELVRLSAHPYVAPATDEARRSSDSAALINIMNIVRRRWGSTSVNADEVRALSEDALSTKRSTQGARGGISDASDHQREHVIGEVMPAAIAALRASPHPDLGEVLDMLSDCQTGSERIRHTVLNLQRLSRQSETRRSAIDINQLIERSLAMVWNEIRQHAQVTNFLKRMQPNVLSKPFKLEEIEVLIAQRMKDDD